MTGRTNGTTPSFFATITIRPPGIVDRPHRHVSAAINYFFEGSGWSRIAGQKHTWAAGDLMLTAPGWAIHHHATTMHLSTSSPCKISPSTSASSRCFGKKIFDGRRCCSARKRASRPTACDLVACVTSSLSATLITGCGRVADLREVCDCVKCRSRTRALPMSTRRRYLSGALAVALVLGVASSAALPASADRNSLNDKKRQQQQVRRQRALIASQIDTLKASDRQIDSALKAINANVQGHPGRARIGPAGARPGEPRCGGSAAGHRGQRRLRSRSCRPPSPASRSTATCTHSATRCWRCSTPRTSVTPHKSARSSRSCTGAMRMSRTRSSKRGKT